jgi:hypothetical protein
MASPNPYCERLGIVVPCVDAVVHHREASLPKLMVVALLEHGGSLPLVEIADRPVDAGAWAPSGDMVLSLTKAWRGRPPLVREPNGDFALDLGSEELQRVLWQLGLRPPRGAVPEPEPLLEPVLPRDDEPLTEEELAVAFGKAVPSSISQLRLVAAVLDTADRPLSMAEINERLARLVQGRAPLDDRALRFVASPMIVTDEGGRRRLDRAVPDVVVVRRAVRACERTALVRQAQELQWKRQWAENEVWREQERRRDAAATAQLRRIVMRVVPDHGEVAGVAVLDVEARAITTFIGASSPMPRPCTPSTATVPCSTTSVCVGASSTRISASNGCCRAS